MKSVAIGLLLGPFVAIAANGQGRSPALTPDAYVADFDFLWQSVAAQYAYLDDKQTDWNRVRDMYRPRVASVKTTRGFLALLEDVLAELYDPHLHLSSNTSTSPRLMPTGAELWAEWRDNRAMITAVRRGSVAARSGLRAGMEVLAVNGLPVREAVDAREPRALRSRDSVVANWALRAVLAGRRDQRIRLATRSGSLDQPIDFMPSDRSVTSLLTATLLAENIGYISINNSLGNSALIAAYDSAVDNFRSARALILDLRETPSGGNSMVARAILGRLVSMEQPYQRHELSAEARASGVRRVWVEYVMPRGTFAYAGPVVVIVGRWTGSMGEGLAIGLDGMKRATVIGTPMAGLVGATSDFTLPNSRLTVRIPTERIFHINGTPRERFTPSVRVEDSDPALDDGLDAALKLLRSSR